MVKAIYKELYPFRSNYLDLEGHRLHYLDEGEGEPIFMLHGNPTWSFYYRHVVSEFKKTHRCVAPDYIGCGLSDKPQDYAYTLLTHIDNIEKLANHLNFEKINLVIHDWGGAIGMGFAIRNPERISRIVIMNTGAFLESYIPLSINICRLPVIGDILIRGFNGFAKGALMRAIKFRDRLTPQIRSGYLSPYNSWKNRIAHLRFVQDIPMTPEVESYSIVEKIQSKLHLFEKNPILICWGMLDFCFNGKFLARWKDIYPYASVHKFSSSGHYLLEDAHEDIIPLMKEFFHYKS